jgi:hypothetical protein
MLFNLSKSFDRQAFGCFFFSVNLLALGRNGPITVAFAITHSGFGNSKSTSQKTPEGMPHASDPSTKDSVCRLRVTTRPCLFPTETQGSCQKVAATPFWCRLLTDATLATR